MLYVVGDIDAVRQSGRTVFDRPEYANSIKYALGKLHPNVALAVQLADAFFVDRLSRKGNEAEYVVTASIIMEFMEASGQIDGIIYKSVGNSGGYNTALKPLSFYGKYTFVDCRACMVAKEYGYGAYVTYQWGPAAIPATPGPILWPDLPAVNAFRNMAIEPKPLAPLVGS